MTVMVELVSSASAVLTPGISFIVFMQRTLGLLVERSVCRDPPHGLLPPRYSVHEGEPHHNFCARAVHDRLAVPPSTQSLKIDDKVLEVVLTDGHTYDSISTANKLFVFILQYVFWIVWCVIVKTQGAVIT